MPPDRAPKSAPSGRRLPPVHFRGDYARITQGLLDEGDLSLVMAHVAALPYVDLERLAVGPDLRRDECRVCQALKDDNYPNEPEDQARHAGFMLVKWHNSGDLKAMYERCLVIYLAARLRVAEEFAEWFQAHHVREMNRLDRAA